MRWWIYIDLKLLIEFCQSFIVLLCVNGSCFFFFYADISYAEIKLYTILKAYNFALPERI